MKRLGVGIVAGFITLSAFAQQSKDDNTLLWKVSGNGLQQPSWLYGTIHLLCAQDANLSDSLKRAISACTEVYFEVDLNNMFELFGAMNKLKMRGDTTLHDLLSEKEYEKVKNYFESKGSMLPFSMLETYKPILAASTLEQGSLPCESTTMMEQVIMEEAKQNNKKIKGLETMAYQAGILDSIPYKIQAQQLVSYINDAGSGDKEDKGMKDMFDAYKEQDLKKLEKLMVETDAGLASFTDILLYQRNRNWVSKLKDLMPRKSLVIAVGAGHLPGEKGLISLLRQAGFTVTPEKNKTGNNREI